MNSEMEEYFKHSRLADFIMADSDIPFAKRVILQAILACGPEGCFMKQVGFINMFGISQAHVSNIIRELTKDEFIMPFSTGKGVSFKKGWRIHSKVWEKYREHIEKYGESISFSIHEKPKATLHGPLQEQFHNVIYIINKFNNNLGAHAHARTRAKIRPERRRRTIVPPKKQLTKKQPTKNEQSRDEIRDHPLHNSVYFKAAKKAIRRRFENLERQAAGTSEEKLVVK